MGEEREFVMVELTQGRAGMEVDLVSEKAIGEMAKAVHMTGHELQVIRGIALGKSNAQIAREMGIQPGTVKTHMRNVYRKMNVHTQIGLLRAIRSYE